jgi:uncharacterized protein
MALSTSRPALPLEAPDPAPILRSLATGGPTLVALSGGVDSSVVAALAFQALGARAHAITLSGPAVAGDELDRATQTAHFIGIDHHVIPADVLADPSYRANPSNRCYFCRRTETSALREWAGAHGVGRFVDGVHVDDLGDDRPGLAAMEEAGFVHPLLQAGWGKSSVRSYARSIGLPNWDAPSNACLASRVAHGQPISAALLRRVEVAERSVRSLGFRRVRVRTDGTGARVVVEAGEVARLVSPPMEDAVRSRVLAAGFTEVVLDPQGYRSRENA